MILIIAITTRTNVDIRDPGEIICVSNYIFLLQNINLRMLYS